MRFFPLFSLRSLTSAQRRFFHQHVLAPGLQLNPRLGHRSDDGLVHFLNSIELRVRKCR